MMLINTAMAPAVHCCQWPGTALKPFVASLSDSHLRCHHYSQITEKESEAHRGQVSCVQSQEWKLTGPGFELQVRVPYQSSTGQS